MAGRDQTQSPGWRERERERYEEELRRRQRKEAEAEAHNEACETDTAVRAAEADGDGRHGNTHPCSSSMDANLGAFHLGMALCSIFRAVILYGCYCVRQTARGAEEPTAAEQMIREKKGNMETRGNNWPT